MLAWQSIQITWYHTTLSDSRDLLRNYWISTERLVTDEIKC
jgi:hypothetical protein